MVACDMQGPFSKIHPGILDQSDRATCCENLFSGICSGNGSDARERIREDCPMAYEAGIYVAEAGSANFKLCC